MNSARTRGIRASYPLLLGMTAGFAVVLFSAALFNIYLTRVMPALRPLLGAVGALYMLWLAAKPFLPHRGKTAAGATGDAASFLTGALLQLVNPKVILHALAVMASFILPYYDSLLAALAFSIALAALGFASVNCWALFGVLFQRHFSAHETALNVVMGLLLVYCAYSVSGLDAAALLG